eukprot:8087467-Pyramimonas_sp.AAC.1
MAMGAVYGTKPPAARSDSQAVAGITEEEYCPGCDIVDCARKKHDATATATGSEIRASLPCARRLDDEGAADQAE